MIELRVNGVRVQSPPHGLSAENHEWSVGWIQTVLPNYNKENYGDPELLVKSSNPQEARTNWGSRNPGLIIQFLKPSDATEHSECSLNSSPQVHVSRQQNSSHAPPPAVVGFELRLAIFSSLIVKGQSIRWASLLLKCVLHDFLNRDWEARTYRNICIGVTHFVIVNLRPHVKWSSGTLTVRISETDIFGGNFYENLPNTGLHNCPYSVVIPTLTFEVYFTWAVILYSFASFCVVLYHYFCHGFI